MAPGSGVAVVSRFTVGRPLRVGPNFVQELVAGEAVSKATIDSYVQMRFRADLSPVDHREMED